MLSWHHHPNVAERLLKKDEQAKLYAAFVGRIASESIESTEVVEDAEEHMEDMEEFNKHFSLDMCVTLLHVARHMLSISAKGPSREASRQAAANLLKLAVYQTAL